MTITQKRIRWQARKAAQRAVPLVACQRCPATTNLQRHHPRLDQPLRVVVLCARCHTAVHIRRGDAGVVKRWAA